MPLVISNPKPTSNPIVRKPATNTRIIFMPQRYSRRQAVSTRFAAHAVAPPCHDLPERRQAQRVSTPARHIISGPPDAATLSARALSLNLSPVLQTRPGPDR